MADGQNGFTVRDRRSFTEQGERKQASEPEEARPITTPSPAPSDPASEDPDESVTLGGFVVTLGAQASMLLAGLPAEDGSAAAPDLRGVRHVIGILEMLQDKTQGRRNPEEDKILEGVLYELRMAYVRATQSSAP